MEGSLGVRKGAWSKEEDDLLRACVERYGERKWHLVPMRAGLSRCRKSCRLRWLNYLRPDIKRGQFTEDEVDLMIRLHRLLGNRWSLIAGRLPGRTANDVKNYWSTNVRKKLSSSLIPKEDTNNIIAKPKGITAVTPLRPNEVIKPKPRTFSTMITSPWLRTGFLIVPYHQQDRHDDENNGAKGLTVDACTASPSVCNKGWRGNEWWGTVLEDKGGNSENDPCYFGDDQQDGKPLTDPTSWNEGLATEADGELLIEGQSWSDLLLDTDLWDFVYQM